MALLALAAAAAAQAQIAEPHIANNGGPPRVYYAHSYYPDHQNRAGLDDRISIHVQNFDALLKEVNGNCTNLILFINGMPLKGLQAESCDEVGGHVRYLLHRTEDAEDVWHKLLGSPRHYAKPVSISVGADPQFAVRSDVSNFELEAVPRFWFLAFIVVAALFIVFVGELCRRTAIIRSGNTNTPVKHRPYSLSLFQMVFWFTLVIVAYVFMWMVNDELDTITESVLALIGIGAATAIGATLIDKSKAQSAEVADATASTPAPVPLSAQPSRGFLHDVLSDAEGISLHRFQMFIWTLVLGVIFVASVYKNLAMPEFSTTLLGLMGISSGTYLGFKVPEKTATDAPAGTTTP
jgi:ABC-type sugar transport system permease subunit